MPPNAGPSKYEMNDAIRRDRAIADVLINFKYGEVTIGDGK